MTIYDKTVRDESQTYIKTILQIRLTSCSSFYTRYALDQFQYRIKNTSML